MMLVATTTASLHTVLEWSTFEETAKGVLRREFVRSKRNTLAANIIQRWWRAKQKELSVDGGR